MLTCPPPRSGTRLYASSYEANGTRSAPFLVDEKTSKNLPNDGRMMFYHISVTPHPVSLSFAKLLRDDDGNEWDCRVQGTLTIVDPCRFLSDYAINIASPGIPLSTAMIESWTANVLSLLVRKSLPSDGRCSRKDLSSGNAVLVKWWQTQVPKWLNGYSINVEVTDACYESATAKTAEAEEARQRELERIARAKERERDAELQEVTKKAAYEKRKTQIEDDWRLSVQEKQHQLQLLEMRHRKEILDADLEIENVRREAERAVLEHELALSRLKGDQSVKQAEDREREAECRHDTVLRELTELREMLTRLPGDLLGQLAATDADRANKAAERLVSPEFNVLPGTLARLGYRVDQQGLMQSLREKALADGEPIAIRIMESVTRTIGTAKVKALPINTSLQFQFSSTKAGYVTLLNVGTSGAVYVHVPNAYVGVQGAKAERGKTYSVPGPELLPWGSLRRYGLDYVEIGPPGWEHLVVLISEKPLLSAKVLVNTSGESPFARLRMDDLQEMCDLLSEEPAGAWCAGVLSFLVG
jgi:hypothetical protein